MSTDHNQSLEKQTTTFRVKRGRDGGIRTPDILLPKQARYQTALHPELSLLDATAWPVSSEAYITIFNFKVNH